MKKVFLLLLSAALFPLCAANDSLTELRSARENMEKDYRSAEKYLQDDNPEIRRFAIYTLAKKKGKKAIPELCRAMSDRSEIVRYTAILALSSMRSEPAVQAQMAKSASDPSVRIKKISSSASWPFSRKNLLLRQDASWDHDVIVVKKFQIPEDNWKLKADPANQGHLKKWFAPTFKDSDWLSVKVGAWEKQGLPDYNGYAWYRIRFTMPEKMDSNAVEIHFGAVDESAWVWLNGIYLGDHDLGLEGWNQPFALDCRKEIRWGKENVLVVRVLDRAHAGGIWKPVSIEILK